MPTVVGTPTSAANTAAGTGLTSRSWTSSAAGNVLMLATQTSITGATITGVTGGGASVTWSRVAGPFTDTIASNVHEIWMGQVVTPGASTIAVTYAASVTSGFQELCVVEFTNGTGAATTWATDGAYLSRNNTSSTTVTYPTLAPAAGNTDIYYGHAGCNSKTPAAGTTTGFTWLTDAGVDQLMWNPALTASTSPTSTINAAAVTATIGVLIVAGVAGVTLEKSPRYSRARFRAACF